MADRQLEAVMAQLAAISASAKTLALHAPDLHAVSYERAVTGSTDRINPGGSPPGVEHHGDEHARDLFHRLEAALNHSELSLRALEWAVGNLLSQGDSPEDVRGYPLQIQRREYREQLRRQQDRRARGDHVPARMVDQPPYPGTAPK